MAETATRYLGALALAAVGVDHLQQYAVDSYSVIPTISTLFALNFVAATLVAAGLVAPVGRIAGRWADGVLAVLAFAGIGIAAASLAGLIVSEQRPLFGFMEQGYRPALVVAIVLEAAAIVLLAGFLVATERARGGRLAPR